MTTPHTNGLFKTVTPEEQELVEKKAELERLSKNLADKELDIEEIRLAVARFQHRYFAEIGKKYVRLDDFRAQIAELRARHSPQDSGLECIMVQSPKTPTQLEMWKYRSSSSH